MELMDAVSKEGKYCKRDVSMKFLMAWKNAKRCNNMKLYIAVFVKILKRKRKKPNNLAPLQATSPLSKDSFPKGTLLP